MAVRASLPARVVHLERARARYGDFPDRFLPALLRSDELADAVVEEWSELPPDAEKDLLRRALAQGIDALGDEATPALRRLFEHVDHVPAWVDRDRIDTAGELLFRAGPAGGLVLGTRSLALSYCSPAGNKPLVFSGGLAEPGERMHRRLNGTSRFVTAVCQRGGMRRHGPGFAHTVQVRLMHAQVRRAIVTSGRWNTEAWGVPINQHDMVAATLLFSTEFVAGLRLLGFAIDDDEADAFLQLWRYDGYVMGVEPELLPASAREAERITGCIELTQGPPDEDARRLVRALVEAPLATAKTPQALRHAQIQVRIGNDMVRLMLGDDRADRLGVPRHATRHLVPALRTGVATFERLAAVVPGQRARSVAAGHRYWDGVLRRTPTSAPRQHDAPR